MKTVFLHGLGQTTHYSGILTELEKRYANMTEPFRICGLSLGALLSLDYTIRHGDKVDSLILMGVQYRVPTLLIDFQNLIFRCMPKKTFENMGMSKQDTIRLCHSMRSLDFSPRLDKIVCPVTIICGEKDGANIKAAKQLKNLLPQAELHIIPGAGHEINKCKPEAVAAIIKSL